MTAHHPWGGVSLIYVQYFRVSHFYTKVYKIMTNKNVVTIKSANVLSNEIVGKTAEELIESLKADDKTRRKATEAKVKALTIDAQGDGKSTAVYRAFAAIEAAKREYNKRISFVINSAFGADVLVTSLITKISESEAFFTPEYLDKLGIYKIPNGLILDTTQKCVSFVSSLYATALSKHKEEKKDGKGVEIILARIKDRITFNDSQFINIKFDKKTILRKYELVYDLLASCTKSEKVAIWARLGVRFATAKKAVLDVGIIPIEGYIKDPLPVAVNFYHEYAADAKPLSKEDTAAVMSRPITPLTSGAKKTAKKTTK